MTIPVQNARKVFDASGGWSNPLQHAFLLENAAHLHVFADDVELVLGVDYTVTGVGDANGYSVTITVPGDWSPEAWALDVRYPVNQPSDVDQGGSFGKRFEDALDRMARTDQTQQAELDRTPSYRPTLPVGEKPVVERIPAGNFWKSDEHGNMVDAGSSNAVNDASAQADRAEAAAEAAEDFRDQAAGYRSQTEGYRNQAGVYRNEAEGFAQDAEGSAEEAADYLEQMRQTVVGGARTILNFPVGGGVQDVDIGVSDVPKSFIDVSLDGTVQQQKDWSLFGSVISPVGGTWPTGNLQVVIGVATVAAISSTQAVPIDGSVTPQKLAPGLVDDILDEGGALRWSDTDPDPTLAADSDDLVPTQKAVKEYVDSHASPTPIDTDPTLSANSDDVVPSQKAAKAYVDDLTKVLFPWASVPTTGKNIWSQTIRMAAQNDFPKLGQADGAVYINTVLEWMRNNLPLGGFVDVGGCTVRVGTPILIRGNDTVLGARYGEVGSLWRDHNAGPLVHTRPVSAGQVVARSGLQSLQVYDLGGFAGTAPVTPTHDSNGYMTNCKATFANSPFGIVFDTVNQPLLRNVIGMNECIAFRGVYGGTVHDVEMQLVMPYNSGRAMFVIDHSAIAGSASPYDEASAGAWWRRINMEGGRINTGTGTVLPSAAYCYLIQNCDGAALAQTHAQSSGISNYGYVAGSGESLYNVRLIDSFSDICAGKGHWWVGDGAMVQHYIHGTVNNGFGSNPAEEDIGLHVTGALARSVFDIDVLAGHTGGITISHAGAYNIGMSVKQAQNINSHFAYFEEAWSCTLDMGTMSGYALDNTTPVTGNGVIFGADATSCKVGGGLIYGCSSYGVAFLSGSNSCSVSGTDLSSNAAPYTDAGSSNSIKGSKGVTDF